MKERTLILDPTKLERVIMRMAWQILELNSQEKNFYLVGISKSGFKLAHRLMKCLSKIYDGDVRLGEISINKKNPPKGPTKCDLDPEDFKGKSVVIVDDVLNSGATLIYAVKYFLVAETKSLSTAVLIDRNHKRFPVKADIKGLSLSTSYQDNVEVSFGDKAAVYLV